MPKRWGGYNEVCQEGRVVTMRYVEKTSGYNKVCQKDKVDTMRYVKMTGWLQL